MELDQFFRERVRWANMIVDIAYIDLSRILALIDYFLQLLVLLGQSLDISINGRETILEIVDLIVEDFVVSVHSHFAINQGVHTLCYIHKVLGVQLFELLHEDLRCSCATSTFHATHVTKILLLLELLLRVLLSDLLVSPCPGLTHGLLLRHSWCLRWLHDKCCASVSDGLNERVVSPPLLHRTSL